MILVDTTFGKWCHMVSDSIEELHIFAIKIGLKREWFQDKFNRPHYDLLKSKKELAIKLGAKEVTRKELLNFLIFHYGE